MEGKEGEEGDGSGTKKDDGEAENGEKEHRVQ